jgi:type 1 glutamine amidotransferase
MRNALIVWGGWDGHEPGQCAELFAPRLQERGFSVEVRDTLDAYDDPARLQDLSLIVPIWTMGAIEKQQAENLVEAVKSGIGVAGFHGGMGDSFRGNIDYQWLVGGQFLAHPDGLKEYAVNIVKPDDPIVAGISDFKVRSEQYYLLVDPRNEVLATTTHQSQSAPWTNGVVMPYVWKKLHGLGRVFYSALGHQAHEFTDVPEQLEITLRGMLWAARG